MGLNLWIFMLEILGSDNQLSNKVLNERGNFISFLKMDMTLGLVLLYSYALPNPMYRRNGVWTPSIFFKNK